MNDQLDYNIAKMFALMRLLNKKYGYSIPNKTLKDLNTHQIEFWMFNLKDPHYQAIRITSSKASEFAKEEKKVKERLEYTKGIFRNAVSFLDIHISREEYDPSYEEFDYANIDYHFHSGVDIEKYYPGIYSAIISDRQPNDINFLIMQGLDIKREAITRDTKTNFKNYPITLSLMILCTVVYGIEMVLSARYSDAASYIIMGAEYKTFTLGLGQYFRLFTNAFLHGSFLHLFSNMLSLFIVGRPVEKILNKKRYILLLLVSILTASLSQGILTENSLLLGLSGGLYGIFIYFMIALLAKGGLNFTALLPTILINLYLNFLSQTAWLAHLGGAIAGMVMFMVYNRKEKTDPIILLVVMLGFMIYKYLSLKTINPFYQATDMEVANIYYEWGLKDYSVKLIARLLGVYKKFGG